VVNKNVIFKVIAGKECDMNKGLEVRIKYMNTLLEEGKMTIQKYNKLLSEAYRKKEITLDEHRELLEVPNGK